MSDHDFEPLLTRKELAEALSAKGYPVTWGTLATLACKGGGPLFRKFGRTPLYRLDDAIAWVEGRLK